MALGETIRNGYENISRSVGRHKLRASLALLGAASITLGIAYKWGDLYDSYLATPGSCSQYSNLIPHPDRPGLDAPITHTVYTPGNTDGGLLDAPLRALFATEGGILVGHASPGGAPDSDQPVDPVRMLKRKGWEVCNSREPILGSVNSVFLNDGEIFVGKDTKDPVQNPGQVVSVFNGQRWTHYPLIPAGRGREVREHRIYDFTDNGRETIAATYQGASAYHRADGWQAVQWVDPKAIHAIEITEDRTEGWVGSLANNVEVYPHPAIAAAAPSAIDKVRDIKESPDRKQIWVAADGGLAFWNRENRSWNLIFLPREAKQVMAIDFVEGRPIVTTLDKGTFIWDGNEFQQFDEEPALSLAVGKGPFEGYVFIGTPKGRLIQKLAA